MRWGAGAGASRLVSGNMTIHRRLEERLADVQGRRGVRCCSAPATSPTPASSPRSRARATSSSPTRSTTPRSSTAAGSSRAETFVYDHCDVEHLEWGLREADGPRRADRHRRRLLDGRRRRAAAREIVELAQRYDARVMVDEAHGIGASGPGGRGAVAEAGLEDEVDVDRRHARQGARLLRRLRAAATRTMAKYLINTARTLIFSTALPPPAVAGAMAALELLREQPRRVEKLAAQRRRSCARRWPSEGMRGRGRRDARSCR